MDGEGAERLRSRCTTCCAQRCDDGEVLGGSKSEGASLSEKEEVIGKCPRS